MNQKIQKLYQDIAMSVFQELPESNWQLAKYTYQAIRRYSFQSGYYLDSTGASSKTFVIDGAGFDAFPLLRTEMAELHANSHAWYTATFTLTPDGKFKFDFDFDHLPTFDIMPSPDKWLDEFKQYPRPELQEQIQDWIDGKIGYDDAGHAEIIARLKKLAS